MIALMSTVVAALRLSMSRSASSSSCEGSAEGFLDNASGALFRAPLTHSVVKLYPMILVFKRWRRGFSISSRRWLLRIGMSGGL